MEARHASSARPGAGRPLERAPTSVLGRVCAPGRVILPQPLHHILDPPDLLLDLPVEHLILKQPESRSKDAATKQRPSGSIPTLRRARTHIPPAHASSRAASVSSASQTVGEEGSVVTAKSPLKYTFDFRTKSKHRSLWSRPHPGALRMALKWPPL